MPGMALCNKLLQLIVIYWQYLHECEYEIHCSINLYNCYGSNFLHSRCACAAHPRQLKPTASSQISRALRWTRLYKIAHSGTKTEIGSYAEPWCQERKLPSKATGSEKLSEWFCEWGTLRVSLHPAFTGEIKQVLFKRCIDSVLSMLDSKYLSQIRNGILYCTNGAHVRYLQKIPLSEEECQYLCSDASPLFN